MDIDVINVLMSQQPSSPPSFLPSFPYFLDVTLGALVGRLHDGSHHSGIAADNQRLVGGIGIDSNSTLADHVVLRYPALPQGVPVRLELAWV